MDLSIPPKIGKTKLCRLEQASLGMRGIAWEVHSHLTPRCRKLVACGKRTTDVGRSNRIALRLQVGKVAQTLLCRPNITQQRDRVGPS